MDVCARYEMTPSRAKLYKPSTADNYDISDLLSDDDTDEEDRPRKKIPTWALGASASYTRCPQFTKALFCKIQIDLEIYRSLSGRLEILCDTSK